MAHHRMCARGEMLVVFRHAGAHASLLCLSKLSTKSNMSSQRPVEQCFEQFAQLAYYAVVQPPETDSEHAGPLVFVIHTNNLPRSGCKTDSEHAGPMSLSSFAAMQLRLSRY